MPNPKENSYETGMKNAEACYDCEQDLYNTTLLNKLNQETEEKLLMEKLDAKVKLS